MIRWLGEKTAADALMQATENVTEAGIKTADLDGEKNTEEVTKAVCAEVEKLLKAQRHL